jgi:hypothetical protein
MSSSSKFNSCLYLMGQKPSFEGTLDECVAHWRDHLSLLGQCISNVHVRGHTGDYWLDSDGLRELAEKSQTTVFL